MRVYLDLLLKNEIIQAFRDIDPRNSLGFDGLPSGFFRQHWDVVGLDVIQLCMDLLSGAADMSSVNQTILVLIPKTIDPMTMRHLPPISLSIVIYKIDAKTIGPLYKFRGFVSIQRYALKLDMEKAYDKVK
ncbi:hypothetical protein GQ457_16G015230 [Hibiscus cannabinus]